MSVALITGGQQGIGLGIATVLRDAGFRIAIAAEQPEDAAPVQDGLAALGPQARYFRHDLSKIEDMPALLDAVERAFGPVTALISNAGVPARIRGDMLDMLPENFDWTMGINLRGASLLDRICESGKRRNLRHRSGLCGMDGWHGRSAGNQHGGDN